VFVGRNGPGTSHHYHQRLGVSCSWVGRLSTFCLVVASSLDICDMSHSPLTVGSVPQSTSKERRSAYYLEGVMLRDRLLLQVWSITCFLDLKRSIDW
jgi:hypothetical protein